MSELITLETEVTEETFAATGSALTFEVKVGDETVDSEKALKFVQAWSDLATKSDEGITKSVEEGAVKVTSTTGAAFAQIVIPADAE